MNPDDGIPEATIIMHQMVMSSEGLRLYFGFQRPMAINPMNTRRIYKKNEPMGKWLPATNVPPR
jgi:hypothetical protein